MNKKTIKYIQFIVFFSFLMNSFFGYAYINIIIAGVPLNEILLIIGITLSIPYLSMVFQKFQVNKLLFIWSIVFLPFVIYGFIKLGKFALRDATHLIEVWWIPLSIIALNNVKEIELKKIISIFVYLAVFKLLLQFFGGPLQGILVIKGLHSDIDLLKSSATAMAFIISIAFWGYIVGLHKNVIIIPLFLLGAVLGQSRTGILSLVLLLVIYSLIIKLRMKIIYKGTAFIFMLIVGYSLLINIPQLSQYTKFNKLLSFEEYSELMFSSFGESQEFEGSAEGTNKRINWRNEIFKKANDDISVFFVGQGFGVPLTDLISIEGNPVREPHNSYLSVFARTGIIGFVLWIIFHVLFNYNIFNFLYYKSKYIKTNFNMKLMFVIYLSLINMYITALTQPGFENPYWAVPAFIIIGTLYSLFRKNRIQIMYEQNKNKHSNPII